MLTVTPEEALQTVWDLAQTLDAWPTRGEFFDAAGRTRRTRDALAKAIALGLIHYGKDRTGAVCLRPTERGYRVLRDIDREEARAL